ncbi:hypothetical protein D0T49_05985 [Paludibacter sp. 221]|uniref:LamG-like jellyroll fold domain-containing protein n=1 Tax=Paludibacter sp. 221 TaxID=2302939 RepID=UPI0013D86DD0|nr:LamG-like jellyroll fold domain-containing protein [Paludibacter sp. 221]NDV46592.1 hypothetical protein [Paludibacter sp. 221]
MKISTFFKQISCIIVLACVFGLNAKADVGYAEFKSTGAGMNALETTIGAATMTVETWLYIDNNAGFFASNMHADKGFLLGFDGHFKFQLDGVSVWIDPATWKGNWTHIACVADGTNMIVYVNGVSAGSQPCAGYNTEADNKPLYLGRAPWGNPFVGKLADFRLWNVARTADEISQNYQKRIAANTAGLVKNFNFMEGTGDNTADLVNPDGNKGWFMGTLDTDYAWGVAAKTPAALQYDTKGQYEFDLTWEGTTGNKWTVEITDPSENVTYRENLVQNTSNFSGLAAGKYKFRVKEASFIATAYSDYLEVTLPLATTLDENAKISGMNLVQTDNLITIKGIEAGNQVVVYGASGQLMFKNIASDEVMEISTTAWQDGLYIIAVEGGKSWKIIR